MSGLTAADLTTICNVLKQYPQVHEAILFGSRAKGTHRAGSDVDIALKGNELEGVTIQISATLNQETLLPYFFDILDFDSIDNQDLIDHIKRVGKVIYTHRE